MSRGARGFTLIELMTSIAILVALFGVLGEAAARTIRANLLARDYADDVLGARRALDAIERDLRAEGVQAAERYRLRGGTLERLAEGRRPAPLARNVARFDVSREGALVRVEIELGKRAGEANRRPALATWVRLRTGEAPR